MEESLFWADQLANKIINRKKFHYTDEKIPKFKEFVVKTSASLSGVLHIGRLSDTIRSSSVRLALKDAGVKTTLIWVAEDMDPLRKVPKGVPESYKKYIGMPVTDIPDPKGSEESYADSHKREYFKVIDEFVDTKMDKYSMREEYKKGHFKEYIKNILNKIEVIKEIQNKYRTNPLPEDWFPWTPICENCGKIATPSITKIEEGAVHYECKDYSFEKTKAEGCSHKGINDPLKGQGKLMWKSEWASQWARWKVCSEGAGKEYQVPNSAWWVNAEIVEKVHNFPMPEPIFYEHLVIDGVKMSASLGNIVYPKDWLEVASPELLRLMYNKRLMKTRSFSWKDLPKMWDEYDRYKLIYLGEKKTGNKKEDAHTKRLFEFSHGKKIEEPIEMAFSHGLIVAQVFEKEQDIIKSLEKTGHYSQKHKKSIFNRIEKAKKWIEKYAPEDMKFEIQKTVPKGLNLTDKQKKALHEIAKILDKDWDEKTLYEEFYSICKRIDITPKELFEAGYKVLLNKERGPKLAPFILAIGKEGVVRILKGV